MYQQKTELINALQNLCNVIKLSRYNIRKDFEVFTAHAQATSLLHKIKQEQTETIHTLADGYDIDLSHEKDVLIEDISYLISISESPERTADLNKLMAYALQKDY